VLAAFIQGPLVRIIPVGLILLAVQRTLLVDLKVDGVVIELLVATAAAAGVAAGSERGAVMGFTLGIMFDLAEGTPLGSTAIALTIAGTVGGLLALVAADPHWWLRALFTALGSAAGVLMVPVVRLFIGEVDPFTTELYVVVPVMAVAGAVLSPVLVPLTRWCLRVKQPEWKQPMENVLGGSSDR
jgi:rod shape-determining protein MreD